MTTLQPPGVAAFSKFYCEFFRDLVALLMMNGASFADAREVAQDTMTKAYQRWSTIDRPKPWAAKVAFRAWTRRVTSNREDPVESLPELGALQPSSGDEEVWINQHDLLRALSCLPPRQRQVMAWTIAGYSPAEIATELGISDEAVRASLMKARRAIIKHLGDPR
jgi:RNA polymerase sigma factor (sigma-70 family)